MMSHLQKRFNGFSTLNVDLFVLACAVYLTLNLLNGLNSDVQPVALKAPFHTSLTTIIFTFYLALKVTTKIAEREIRSVG